MSDFQPNNHLSLVLEARSFSQHGEQQGLMPKSDLPNLGGGVLQDSLCPKSLLSSSSHTPGQSLPTFPESQRSGCLGKVYSGPQAFSNPHLHKSG